MKGSSRWLAALLVAAAPMLAGAADDGPQRIAWFKGTFEEALVKAKAEKKVVFLEFWADWCGWCKRLQRETLIDPGVVAEAKDLLCLSVDSESKDGQPLAARFGVGGLPALVFLEPDGSLRDRMAGYRSGPQFVIELKRIKANQGTLGEIERKLAADPKNVSARLELVFRLRRMTDGRWQRELAAAREAIARGEGFDPKDPDERFEIARKLRMCGDDEGYKHELAEVRALDPEGKSVSMRKLALNDLVQALNVKFQTEAIFEPAPIEAFLADEQHASVRFDGWSILHAMASNQAELSERRAQASKGAEARAAALRYGRLAWKDCPEDRVGSFGRELAQNLLADAGLSDEDRAFAVEVADKASQAAPQDADHLVVLARCLERAGRKEDAIATLRRAIAIEPDRASIRRRLEDLER
jgi:thiol-disulfide isomerase/thioredoxin